MSNKTVAAQAAPYGAFEIKAVYQKNYTKGLLISFVAHLALIGAYFILMPQTVVTSSKPPFIVDGREFLLPPPIVEKPLVSTPISLPKSVMMPDKGIPVPVPDAVELINKTLAVQGPVDEPPLSGTKGPGGPVVNGGFPVGPGSLIIDEPDPGQDTLVPVEEYPQVVKMVSPVYPPMARNQQVEGTVYANLLVDTQGRVKKVEIKKGNAIFHEAVLAAAKDCLFTPAIQNGHPVKIWMMVPFRFELK